MKKILFSIFISFSTLINAQNYQQSIIEFQEEMNKEFLDTAHSPLDSISLLKFKGLSFFPIDKKYKVEAKFIKNKNTKTIEFKTSTKRKPIYDIYGKAIFKIGDKTIELNIFQSHYLRDKEEYKNYLFLPFFDLTNGNDTYGGGRYLDLKIPEGNTIIIDFNKAYHPYCAYSYKYSCPVPPEENFIDLRIEAGIKN
jgi:uncharacterized protein (DUF1684 family)